MANGKFKLTVGVLSTPKQALVLDCTISHDLGYLKYLAGLENFQGDGFAVITDENDNLVLSKGAPFQLFAPIRDAAKNADETDGMFFSYLAS